MFKYFHFQENHVETPEERAKKTKLFLIHAVEHWDAEFYAKINDDVYVNIGMCSLICQCWKGFCLLLALKCFLWCNELIYNVETDFDFFI